MSNSDNHPTYQKVLYIACWVMLAVILIGLSYFKVKG